MTTQQAALDPGGLGGLNQALAGVGGPVRCRAEFAAGVDHDLDALAVYERR